MPLLLITGTFRPGTGVADGDTVRFAPDNRDLVLRLTRQGAPPRINASNGTIPLRYEGVDAMERDARLPESSDATARNLQLIGVGSASGEARGHVFSRTLDDNGRVIAFVFPGAAPETDGSEVNFDVARMQGSVNYQLLAGGLVYPLFYDTLFGDLRQELTRATQAARQGGGGVWRDDATNSGITWGGRTSLATLPPLLPKLWRRLEGYTTDREFRDESDTLAAFPEYMRMRNDRLLVVSENRFTGLDNVITVDGNRLSLNYLPEDLVFMS